MYELTQRSSYEPNSMPVSDSLLSRGVILSDSGLRNSIRVVAGPGAGKSRWAGRLLLFQRLIRGRPAICLDPTGGIVGNLFDKICRLPGKYQEKLWPRIRYVDMAAQDYIVPMPLYHKRSPYETLATTAGRYLEVIRRLDPHLMSASVEGWNALYEVGLSAGMMAAHMGLQVTDVADMVRNPKAWRPRFRAAHQENPMELQVAYDFFMDLLEVSNPVLRKRRTSSFAIKLMPFLVDPVMQATFAATEPGIDIDWEMERGHLVVYDFQGEHDAARRRLKLLWTFLEHVEFAKRRGIAGRQNPVFYVIDEITQLLGQNPLEQSIMADDFNEVVTVLARNYGFPTCLMSQNLSQIDERTQVSLGQIGTQVIGNIQEPADRLRLAQQFFRYDPHLERKEEPVWMSLENPYTLDPIRHYPAVIDYTSTEYGLEEQVHLLADRFSALGRFRFLVRAATAEGHLAQDLRPMSIERLDMGQYPDDALVAEVRRRLRRRDGVPLDTLLTQNAQRRQEQLTVSTKPSKQKVQKPKSEDDTIEEDQATHGAPTTDNLPEPEPATTAVTEEEPAPNEADWKQGLWGTRQETRGALDQSG